MLIPHELATRPQWLVWRFEPNPDPKKEKPLKVPYYAGGGRRVGDQGDERDRMRLVSLENAQKVVGRGFDGVGFAFLPGDGLIGIDLDKVIDADGVVSDRATEIIKACASFTELSPSGTGVHIICAGDTAPLFEDGKSHSFKSNKIGVEVFCGAQYFTFTGNHYAGTPDTVNEIPLTVLRRLKATVDGAKGKRQPKAGEGRAAPSVPAADDEQRRVESALVYVSADEYQDWIDVGHAIKRAFGGAGLSIWDRWSMKSAKYDSGEIVKRWESFQPRGEGAKGVTLGTVFALAKRGGWSPPRTPRKPRASAAADPGRREDDRPAGPPGDDSPPPDHDDGPPDDFDDGELPLIRWQNGLLPYKVSEAEQALLAAAEGIYQRSGQLVRIVRRDTPSVRNYKRKAGSLGLHPIDAAYLVETFTRVARWEKYDAKSKKWRRINAPEQAAGTYLARVGQWKLPRLWSVINAPSLRPDGTVLQKPGYDAATECWYEPGDTEFPTVSDEPSMGEAKHALEVLVEAFGTFPFDTGIDRSVYLSLVLTALVRRSLPASPLFAISAPVMASGKTLAADVASILPTGGVAPAMTFPDSDEEAAKTALAVLMEGDQVVLIDNVSRPLRGDWLCTVLTGESFRQRLLGSSKMVDVPTTTAWIATGNHIVIEGDLRTRSLLCRLDPKCEHPELRQFEGDMRERMMSERPQLVAAGLTVMRAFICARRKDPRGLKQFVKPYGRFEHWTEMIRAPLLWLGEKDPCESIKAIEADDPLRDEHIQVITAWHAVYGTEEVSAAEVLESVGRMPADLTLQQIRLYEAVRPIAMDKQKNLSARRLGHWLRQHAKRRVTIAEAKDGQPAVIAQFMKSGVKDNTGVWRIEIINEGEAPTA